LSSIEIADRDENQRDFISDLLEVGKLVAHGRELSDVIRGIVDRAARMVPCEAVALFLVNRAGFLRLEANRSTNAFEALPVELEVRQGNKSGLTGALAKAEEAVCLRESALRIHSSVRSLGPHPHLVSSYCKALIAVPLRYQDGRFMGLLKFENSLRNDSSEFSDEEFSVAHTVAAFASIAIENARSFARLSALQGAAIAASSSLDFDDVSARILVELRKLVPCDSATIQLRDGNLLRVVACEGFQPDQRDDVLSLTFPLEETFPNTTVISEGKVLCINDVTSSRYAPFVQDAALYHAEHIRSWMGVPLRHGQNVVGMLAIDSKQLNRYDEANQQDALAFATQVVHAIVNAGMYSDGPVLLATVKTLAAESSLKLVLQRLVEAAVGGAGINADSAIVYSYDQDGSVERPVYAGRLRSPEQIMPPFSGDAVVYKVGDLASAIFVENVAGHPLLARGFVAREGIASSVVLPLVQAGQKLGIMFMNFKTAQHFSPGRRKLISVFREFGIVALENAKRHQLVVENLDSLKQSLEEEARRNVSIWRTVAHQIRSPLHQSLFRLDALIEECPAGVDRRSLKAVRGLIRGARRVAAQRDMFAALDQQKLVARSERLLASFVIPRVIEAAEDYGLQQDPKRRIEFFVERDGFSELDRHEVRGEWALIEHVLHNLLDNAGKYSYDETKVCVSAGLTNTGRFYISVSNTGIPLRHHDVANCCEKGWRGDDAKFVCDEGVGLGLYLAREIMRLHRGELLPSPTTRGRTDFRMVLPSHS